MRARHLLHPSGDARLAPHSGLPDCGEPIPSARLNPPSGLIPPTRPPNYIAPAADSPLRPSGRGRACPGRDPGAGVRWGLAFNKIPHPEEAAKAAVSMDAPLPPVIPAQAEARGLDPRGGTHRPNAAVTAPAPAAGPPLRPLGGERVGVRWGYPQTRFVRHSLHRSYAAAAPAPRIRGCDEHRTGINTHPEN